MKKKLLAIGLITMLGINIQASDLLESILQSPIASAAIGYVVENIGHQVVNGCNLNPFVQYTKISVEKEFDLVGLQFMGASIYRYVDWLKAPYQRTGGDHLDKIYNIARFTPENVCEMHDFNLHINYAERIVYQDGDEEKIGVAIVFNLDQIGNGLKMAVVCGSAAWLTAP